MSLVRSWLSLLVLVDCGYKLMFPISWLVFLALIDFAGFQRISNQHYKPDHLSQKLTGGKNQAKKTNSHRPTKLLMIRCPHGKAAASLKAAHRSSFRTPIHLDESTDETNAFSIYRHNHCLPLTRRQRAAQLCQLFVVVTSGELLIAAVFVQSNRVKAANTQEIQHVHVHKQEIRSCGTDHRNKRELPAQRKMAT